MLLNANIWFNLASFVFFATAYSPKFASSKVVVSVWGLCGRSAMFAKWEQMTRQLWSVNWWAIQNLAQTGTHISTKHTWERAIQLTHSHWKVLVVLKKEKSLDDYISEDDDDGCNESKMMMAGGGWWWLLYPAGPLYCYWPTLITLLPTLNDTGDNHGGGKP